MNIWKLYFHKRLKVLFHYEKPICFVASARDYHAIDWYRTVKHICPNRRILIATDLIESEGVTKLVDQQDELVILFNLTDF